MSGQQDDVILITPSAGIPLIRPLESGRILVAYMAVSAGNRDFLASFYLAFPDYFSAIPIAVGIIDLDPSIIFLWRHDRAGIVTCMRECGN